MKNILIVMHGMNCGGAEKSLIAFLSNIPKNKWNIDLIVANSNGLLMKDIPPTVNIIDNLIEFENYATPISGRKKKIANLQDFFCQLSWQIRRHLYLYTNLSYGELRWKLWGKYLPRLKMEYDLAISYMNGFTNYYVIEKVTAKKKIIWIHNEFEKLGYNYEFEKSFYKKADKVVTISKSCLDSFIKVFPEYKYKTTILENISSYQKISRMAEVKLEDSFFHEKRVKLLSVGRLMEQKGYDLAICAAKILNDRGMNFVWYVLGEGELRKELERQVEENDLMDQFKLVGLKENPYPYMSKCDVFVQTSRYEGKSIVLDEAKILNKPIVVTNYGTVESSITDGVNGIVVEMTETALADGIESVVNNSSLMERLVKQLKNDKNGNESEINKYCALIEGMLDI